MSSVFISAKKSYQLLYIQSQSIETQIYKFKMKDKISDVLQRIVFVWRKCRRICEQGNLILSNKYLYKIEIENNECINKYPAFSFKGCLYFLFCFFYSKNDEFFYRNFHLVSCLWYQVRIPQNKRIHGEVIQ